VATDGRSAGYAVEPHDQQYAANGSGSWDAAVRSHGIQRGGGSGARRSDRCRRDGANVYADCGSNGDPNDDAHGNAHAHAVTDEYSSPDIDAKCDPHCDAHEHAQSYGSAHADADDGPSDIDAKRDWHCVAHANAQS